LTSNILLNSFKNTIPEKLALSDHEGEIELFIADDKSTGSSSISMHKNYAGFTERVKAVTLDDYVLSKGITRADIVKVDVEGSETMVIRGMRSVMKNLRPMILIEILEERLSAAGSSKEELFQLFKENDYSSYLIMASNTLKVIEEPVEAGLAVFKHNQTNFPKKIMVL